MTLVCIGPLALCASSLRRNVLSILHRQQDARAVVEAVAVFFGPVVDALGRDDFLLADKSLAESFAEFRRARLARFQRGRNHALEHLEGIVGMAHELAAAVGAVLSFIG